MLFSYVLRIHFIIHFLQKKTPNTWGLWEPGSQYEIKMSFLFIYWNITYLFILFDSLQRTDQVYGAWGNDVLSLWCH